LQVPAPTHQAPPPPSPRSPSADVWRPCSRPPALRLPAPCQQPTGGAWDPSEFSVSTSAGEESARCGLRRRFGSFRSSSYRSQAPFRDLVALAREPPPERPGKHEVSPTWTTDAVADTERPPLPVSRRVSEEIHRAMPAEDDVTVTVSMSADIGRLTGARQLAAAAQAMRTTGEKVEEERLRLEAAREEERRRQEKAKSRTKERSGAQPIFLNIASSPGFDPCILGLIVISSIALAIDSPYIENTGKLGLMLNVVDKISVIAFTLEMIVRMGAFGIVKAPPDLPSSCPKPYFRVGWNWIDFFIVLAGLLEFIMSLVFGQSSSLKTVRTLRVLRVLRPLRLVKSYKGVRVLVEGLLQSVHTLVVVSFIGALFYVGFGIWFVNLLQGQLWHCSLDPSGRHMPLIETRDDCIAAGGDWVNNDSNFDNLGAALVTLLHVSMGEGWLEVLIAIVDSRGINLQPRKGARIQLALPVILFVALSNFCMANLTIGVLVDQYMTTKAEVNHISELDEKERQWIEMQSKVFFGGKGMSRFQKVLYGSELFVGFRGRLCDLVESREFDAAVLWTILVNTLFLCLDHPTASPTFRNVLSAGSLVCIVLFNAETVLRIFVFRRIYFKEPWNVFDLVVVVACDIGGLAELMTLDGPTAQILQAFRVGRVLRLTRYVGFMQVMVETLTEVMPGLLNVMALLGLMIFMFACLGVGLFGTVDDSGSGLGGATFHSFGDAVLLLFRGATGERWHLVMHDLATSKPGCTTEFQTPQDLAEVGPRGCGTLLAYPFFVIYELLVYMVLLNLLVSVILDTFRRVRRRAMVAAFERQLRSLVELWHSRDYDATGYVELDAVVDLLLEIPPPVGFLGSKRKRVVHCMRFLPLFSEARLHFRDVVIFVARRCYLWLRQLPEGDTEKVSFDPTLLLHWIAQFPDVEFKDVFEDDCVMVAHVIIASHVIRFVNSKRDQWRLAKVQREERAKRDRDAARRNQMKSEVHTGGMLQDDGAGVGTLPAPEAEAPSMLLPQLSPAAMEAMPQLSPLPWPPPLS